MPVSSAAEQWRKLLASLSLRQRVSIAVVAVLVIAGAFAFARWRQESDFKPLFTNMAAEDAGAVVAKLKESGNEYRVTDNGATVLVRTDQVAESRLALAGAGLPKTGRIGFELFDKANLGTTDFVEQVNYRRALEGELERSIRTVAEVEQARVHLTFPKDSVFLESKQPAKASVLLRVKPRARLDAPNVSAISHLVASAVEGLSPEAVAVMDVNGNLLNRPKKTQDLAEASDEAIEYRKRVEKDLIEKVNSTLQPLLGEGRFRAGVSVDCDFSGGEQSEETYDPEKSVMLNSTKTEETTGGSSVTAGVPGTAANLPRGTGRASGGAGPTTTRRSETIAYQTSKTVRRVKLPQGMVRRISASILLDQANRWEQRDGKTQRVLVATPPETVRAIREVVSAAIGFNQTRGDLLVIESLPFESTLHEAPPDAEGRPAEDQAPAPAQWWTVLLERRVEAGILVFLVCLAVWTVLRHRKKKTKPVTQQPVLPGGAQPSLPASPTVQKVDGEQKRMLGEAETGLQPSRVETLVEALRDGIAQDPALAASVLRTWLEEKRT